MPIYEFACRSCGRTFEELVSVGSAPPPCPACASSDAQRLLSAHAVGGGQPDPAPAGCGRCGDPRGPGACRFDN